MSKIRYIFLIWALISPMILFGQESEIKEAETAYSTGDFEKAVTIYESVLHNYGESPQIYYNLGNAYFKAGKLAPAILNYEKALVLQPNDRDIRFNLQIAKAKTVDKIDPIDEFFLNKWFKSVRNIANIDTWGILGIVFFVVMIVCLSLFFFSRKILFKKIAFYTALFSLFVVFCANIFASSQKSEIENRSSAIIFDATVTVKSSPDESGTDLFVLHEGTKVYVKSTLGTWNEIELEDGNIGWLPSKSIEKI